MAREVKIEELCASNEYDIKKVQSDKAELCRDLASYESNMSEKINVDDKLRQLGRIS